MPNRHSTLTSLFSDVADAIRSKTGGTAELVADNFDTAIEGIQTQKPEQSKTATPSTSQQTVEPDEGYALSSVTVNAMPSGNVGTVTATKGTVSSNSISVTPQVAAGTAGYNAHTAYSGSAVTVSASELVSDSKSIRANGTYDVTNYASAIVNVQPDTETFSVTPTTSTQTIIPSEGFTFSMGVVEAMPSGTITADTPTINTSTGLVNSRTSVSKAGYLNTGTYSRNLQLDTQAATTITPSASAQTAVAAGKYTTGAVTVAAIQTQTKTTTANGTVTPDSGKYLTSVTVAIPSYTDLS